MHPQTMATRCADSESGDFFTGDVAGTLCVVFKNGPVSFVFFDKWLVLFR